MKPAPNHPRILAGVHGEHPMAERLNRALRRIRVFGPAEIRRRGTGSEHEDILAQLRMEAPRLRWDQRHVSDYEEDKAEKVGSRTLRGDRVRVVIPVEGDWSLLLHPLPQLNGRFIGVGALEDRRRVVLTYWDPMNMKESLGVVIQQDEALLRECERLLAVGVEEFEAKAGATIEAAWEERARTLGERTALVESLGIPLVQRGDQHTVLTVPLVRKQLVVPQIGFPAPGRPERLWHLPEEDFATIIRIIQAMSLVIERSPRAFERMEEEDVRWHFLVQLNGQYEWSATGETFSCAGKTDILVSYEGRCVFVAECKYWKGAKSASAAVDQLLSYLSWRDTKAALIIFVRESGFTGILVKLEQAIQEHPACVAFVRRDGETATRWRLLRPGDPERSVDLCVLAFDMPQSTSSATDPMAPAQPQSSRLDTGR
jgi:hypothetical protein